MKKYIVLSVFSLFIFSNRLVAQSSEVQQLLLNVTKLEQLKKILNNMYKGYSILTNGYNTIKSISAGNFNIHQIFLDGLLQVSPGVRKYKKVGDIIKYQLQLVREVKPAINKFKASRLFNETESNYMEKVYSDLFNKSFLQLEALAMVLTAGKLRMSDDERLNAIDRIYFNLSDQLAFLHSFTTENTILALQRGRSMVETKLSQKLSGF